MKLSDKQKQIYDLLQGINPLASQAYLGAFEVLEGNHKNKLPQSANSIRHALRLITRNVKVEQIKGKSPEKGGNKKKIRKLVDPLAGLPSELDFHTNIRYPE